MQPLESILEACSETEQRNPYLLESVLEAAVQYRPTLAAELMDTITEHGRPIRPHYFWPLIKRAANAGDVQGESLYIILYRKI